MEPRASRHPRSKFNCWQFKYLHYFEIAQFSRKIDFIFFWKQTASLFAVTKIQKLLFWSVKLTRLYSSGMIKNDLPWFWYLEVFQILHIYNFLRGQRVILTHL